jgi:hypothetical protein
VIIDCPCEKGNRHLPPSNQNILGNSLETRLAAILTPASFIRSGVDCIAAFFTSILMQYGIILVSVVAILLSFYGSRNLSIALTSNARRTSIFYPLFGMKYAL